MTGGLRKYAVGSPVQCGHRLTAREAPGGLSARKSGCGTADDRREFRSTIRRDRDSIYPLHDCQVAIAEDNLAGKSYSRPYSTATRHASLALEFARPCRRKPCVEVKSASHAGQDSAPSEYVERDCLRGDWGEQHSFASALRFCGQGLGQRSGTSEGDELIATIASRHIRMRRMRAWKVSSRY